MPESVPGVPYPITAAWTCAWIVVIVDGERERARERERERERDRGECV